MKVKATVTEITHTEVEVYHGDLEESLRAFFLKNKPGQYINSFTGNWESWYDTGHGSGSTTVYRAATPDEIADSDALTRVFKMLRSQ